MNDASGSEDYVAGTGLLPPRKRQYRRSQKPTYAPVVLPFDNPYRFLVQSQRDPASFYLVDLEEVRCDCDHHRIRKPPTCKHIKKVIRLSFLALSTAMPRDNLGVICAIPD